MASPMIPQHASKAGRWLVTTAFALAAWATAAPALAAAPAPDRATAQYEVRFMQDMIDHHAMAVHMAEICVGKAAHEALATMCQDIVDAQTQEIAILQQWLGAWYGITHEPEMTQGHHNMMERMAAMSAEEFEVMFLEMMIRHHWGAVVKASTCVDRAWHDALVGMCEDMVIAQSAEIEQMRTWLCEWYGLCNYGPKNRRAQD